MCRAHPARAQIQHHAEIGLRYAHRVLCKGGERSRPPARKVLSCLKPASRPCKAVRRAAQRGRQRSTAKRTRLAGKTDVRIMPADVGPWKPLRRASRPRDILPTSWSPRPSTKQKHNPPNPLYLAPSSGFWYRTVSIDRTTNHNGRREKLRNGIGRWRARTRGPPLSFFERHNHQARAPQLQSKWQNLAISTTRPRRRRPIF